MSNWTSGPFLQTKQTLEKVFAFLFYLKGKHFFPKIRLNKENERKEILTGISTLQSSPPILQFICKAIFVAIARVVWGLLKVRAITHWLGMGQSVQRYFFIASYLSFRELDKIQTAFEGRKKVFKKLDSQIYIADVVLSKKKKNNLSYTWEIFLHQLSGKFQKLYFRVKYKGFLNRRILRPIGIWTGVWEQACRKQQIFRNQEFLFLRNNPLVLKNNSRLTCFEITD